jgi:lipopolysaccharide transport system permease protein
MKIARAALNALRPLTNLRAVIGNLRLLHGHRDLIKEMARREIRSQYGGQALGTWWVIGHPLFQMLVYITVFALIFKVRVGGTVEMPRDYITYLLSGLVPWLCAQQAVARGPTLMTSQANLVKQVVFPIQVIPAASVLVNFILLAVGLAVLLLYSAIKHGSLAPTVLMLPLLVCCLAMGMLGISYAFAAIGVFFRDLKDVVQVLVIAGVYLMPIFYLPEWVPALLKPLLYVNPFSYMGWCFQDAIYFGRFEHPGSWIAFCVGSVLLHAMGYRLFQRLAPNFGNAL